MRISIALIIITGFCHTLMAQEKYERERRISVAEVPAAAVSFLDSCEFESRVKWHEEESLEGKSVEATAKKSRLRYSIEFDTLGSIQDVEIDHRESQVPILVMTKIHQYLDSSFVRYRLKNIQVQWTGSRSALLDLVRSNQTPITHTTRYELIVKGRDDSGVQLYEILFSDKGEMIRRSVIIFRHTDHLDY